MSQFLSKQTQNYITHHYHINTPLFLFPLQIPIIGRWNLIFPYLLSHYSIDGQFWNESKAEIDAMTRQQQQKRFLCMRATAWTNCRGRLGPAPAWLCAWDRLYSPSLPFSSCVSTFSSIATQLSGNLVLFFYFFVLSLTLLGLIWLDPFVILFCSLIPMSLFLSLMVILL